MGAAHATSPSFEKVPVPIPVKLGADCVHGLILTSKEICSGEVPTSRVSDGNAAANSPRHAPSRESTFGVRKIREYSDTGTRIIRQV